jgi:hypothetical protein
LIVTFGAFAESGRPSDGCTSLFAMTWLAEMTGPGRLKNSALTCTSIFGIV